MSSFWHLYLFLFSGGDFIFVGWSLWSCFRLYLDVLLCTCLALATFVLPCWDIHVRGSKFFFMFLVSNCLLTYVYEFFIDICLYYVLFEIKILFYLLVFSTHAAMHFV